MQRTPEQEPLVLRRGESNKVRVSRRIILGHQRHLIAPVSLTLRTLPLGQQARDFPWTLAVVWDLGNTPDDADYGEVSSGPRPLKLRRVIRPITANTAPYEITDCGSLKGTYK